MRNLINIIKIYLFVCEKWDNSLKYSVSRFSNNNNPKFTDQEIMTIMLYCTAYEKRLKVKEIYNFTANYLTNCFPLLPSYTAFVTRLNRLYGAFRELFSILVETYSSENSSDYISMVDSMPIITCSGKRKAKVALEITDKGYCSTKSLYYHGVKLHLLSSPIKGRLPFPESIAITPASESDLNVFRDNWSELENKCFFGDKIYQDRAMQKQMLRCNSEMLSPVKYPRGVCESVKKFFKAADDLYSRAISKTRQPIESFFNWLIEHTDIQRASKVRSVSGLIVHIFNKLAAICSKKWVFNS